ncbi:MAG TPA: hypothetical protein VMN36_11140 [Verrucomicrobiales bacterium]|nr:hypothetical protein [Verrucomicrobiales bacterium]
MRGYTLIEDWALTEAVTRDVDRSCAAILDVFAGKVTSVALVGGYGRGEGGASRTPSGWRPRNNYDFLVVLPGRISPGKRAIGSCHARLKAMLDSRLQAPFEASYQREHRLRKAPPIMFFQDVRRASRTLYGRDVRRLLPDSVLEPLPAVEAVRVLRTRSILLLSSELREPFLGYRPDPEQKRTWLAKAVIGYGDALMILLGCYRTLYAGKRDGMQALDLSAVFEDPGRALAFRDLHLAASRYRLEDAGSALLDDWEAVRELLGEAARWVYGCWLGVPAEQMTWEHLRDAPFPVEDDLWRQVRNGLVALRIFRTPWPWRLLAVHPRDALLRAAPLLLFDGSPAALEVCRRELRLGPGAGPEALRDACLRLCARCLV